MSTKNVGRLSVLGASWIARASSRPALAIFLLALALRLAWIATLPDRLEWPDEQEFAAVAQHLVAGHGYVSSSYRANPVVPVYLAVFLRTFGETYVLARIGQCILGALTCVLVYRLGLLLAGPVAGVVGGLVLAFYPGHVYLSGVFYVTCIATFLTTWTMLLLVRLPSTRRPVLAGLGAGAVLGVLCLTRATFLAYVPCACLAIVWAAPSDWRRLAPAAAALVLAVVTLVAPWSVRNSLHFDHPMLVSSGLWETLWKGNNEVADGSADDRNMAWNTPLWESRLARLSHDERTALEAKYEVIADSVRESYAKTQDIFLSRDDVLKPYVVDYVVSDPLRIAGLFVRKVATLFDSFSDTEKENEYTSGTKKLIASVTFYPILVLALVGAALALPAHRRYAPIYLMIASYVALYGLLTACTRFRLPIDPLLIVFASVAIERLLARARVGIARDRQDRFVLRPTRANS